MKSFIRLSFIIIIFAGILVTSCDQDDVQRPISQYAVKYELKSHLDTTSGFFVTYYNPKYANLVSEYFENIKTWKFEFTGKTFDHLFLEAYSVRDSALFDITIYVNGKAMVTERDSCPWPVKCDTNRVAVKYTLE